MHKIIITILTLWISGIASANQLNDRLYKASLQYDEGNYSAAAASYEKLIKDDFKLPGIYYNLGNAYFKQSMRGAAVAAYLKAYLMSPGDADIKANLLYSMKDNKDKVGLPSYKGSLSTFYRPLLESTPLDLFWFTIICFSIFFLCLSAALFFNRSSKLWFFFSLCSFISSLYFLGSIFILDRSSIEVASSLQDVSVYSEPNDVGSVLLFNLHTGVPMKVIAKRNSHYKVELADGKKGWIKAGQLKVF